MFRLLTGCVTAESLLLLLQVLKPKQAVEDLMEGDEEGEESASSHSEDEEGGDQEDDDHDDHEDDDHEDDDHEDDDHEDDDHEDDDHEDDDLEGDGEEGDEPEGLGNGIDPAFAADVRRALGKAAVNSEGEVSLCSTFLFLN